MSLSREQKRFIWKNLGALWCLIWATLGIALFAVAIDRDWSWFRIIKYWAPAVIFLWLFTVTMIKTYGSEGPDE